MHSDEKVLHKESGGTAWKTSYRCCIMRKVISKKVATGGRFRFFLDLHPSFTPQYLSPLLEALYSEEVGS